MGRIKAWLLERICKYELLVHIAFRPTMERRLFCDRLDDGTLEWETFLYPGMWMDPLNHFDRHGNCDGVYIPKLDTLPQEWMQGYDPDQKSDGLVFSLVEGSPQGVASDVVIYAFTNIRPFEDLTGSKRKVRREITVERIERSRNLEPSE